MLVMRRACIAAVSATWGSGWVAGGLAWGFCSSPWWQLLSVVVVTGSFVAWWQLPRVLVARVAVVVPLFGFVVSLLGGSLGQVSLVCGCGESKRELSRVDCGTGTRGEHRVDRPWLRLQHRYVLAWPTGLGSGRGNKLLVFSLGPVCPVVRQC